MAPPNPPLSWIASPIKRKTSAHPDPASGVRSVVGRPAKATAGLVAAAMSGIRSIREVCAPPASTTGLQPSAPRVPAGRRIPTGTRADQIKRISGCGSFFCRQRRKQLWSDRPAHDPLATFIAIQAHHAAHAEFHHDAILRHTEQHCDEASEIGQMSDQHQVIRFSL